MKLLMKTTTLLLLVMCGCGSIMTLQDEPLPPGRLGDNVTPLAYDLDLTIQPEQDHFSGTARIAIDIAKPTRKIWMHGQDLDVDKVILVQDGIESTASYRQENDFGVSSVSFAEAQLGRGELVFTYHAPFHQARALYNVAQGGEHYVFSYLEAIDARGVFPGFDEPRFKTRFKVSVTTAAGNKVVFNSPQVRTEDLGDGNVRHRFAETKPLPTYLLAFAVGPFDVVDGGSLPKTALRDHEVPLRAITVKGKGGKTDYALKQTARLVASLETYFGMPYPFAKLDLIGSPGNIHAMENAGAIVFPEQLLTIDESSPPFRLGGFYYVSAHELSHMWFGDLVTPEWWEDIWLNESFATWMGTKTADRIRPDLAVAISQQKFGLDAIVEDSSSATRPIRQPIHDNAVIRNAFDDVTYAKGAAVLRMVEAFVGEKAFQAGVRHHLGRFAYRTANSADFFESMFAGSGDPRIQRILQSFVNEVGAPQVDITVTCDDDGARMQASQSRYRPLGMTYPVDTMWQLPLCYRTESGRHCELVGSAQATLALPSCPAWLLPNANGDGYYRWNLDDASWRKLVRHRDELSAPELVNLTDAVQSAYSAGTLGSATLLDLEATLGRNDDREVSSMAIGFLPFMRIVLLDGERTTDYRRFIASIIGPRLESLGFAASPGDSPSTRKDRVTALWMMADEAEKPEVRARLAKTGARYLQDIEAGADTAYVPDEEVSLVLTMLVTSGDTATLRRLEDAALASTDTSFRFDGIYALSTARDPAYLEHIYTELLPDPKLPPRERWTLLRNLAWNPFARTRNFRWIRDHLDLVLEGVRSMDRTRVAEFAEGFCDGEGRQMLANFLATAEEKIPGITAPGRKSLDTIDRCIALRHLKSNEFRQALAHAAASIVDSDTPVVGSQPARSDDLEGSGGTP